MREIRERLRFLNDVGVGYLTLGRGAATLSGGEGQRIRLATQIGSQLTGVLYVLDEPSIGLHQRDNRRLLATLGKLRNLGNTVLVVEHDEETIRTADYLVDLGPGAGEHGGHVMFQGRPQQLLSAPGDSLTGQYLTGQRVDRDPATKRAAAIAASIVVRGARANNLKNIDVAFPLGMFIAVTGVSGSGKSTLVNEILYRSLARDAVSRRRRAGRARRRSRASSCVDKVIQIDQSPIGRTPRSNPATYTGLFTFIRELFAMLPDARARGYTAGRFSFNVKGGRCETCQGDGVIAIEMHFLPNVYVTCEECKGRRYNRETLDDQIPRQVDRRGARPDRRSGAAARRELPADRATSSARCRTSGSATSSSGSRRRRCRGGEAQRVKLSRGAGRGAAPAARSTSSTSRRPACTSRTSRRLLEVLEQARRSGQHDRRHRAQPRRHQVGRLGHRSGPGGRRRGRPRGGCRGGRQDVAREREVVPTGQFSGGDSRSGQKRDAQARQLPDALWSILVQFTR